jgi:Ca2+-binding EF-hand superfamily protein
VVAGLLAKQKQFESTDASKKQMNFDKILLKFPRIQKVLKKTGKLFDSMDADKNGSLDVEELCEAMTELNVSMSKEEVADLFKHSDMEENAKMNKREFLVCLSTGYVQGVDCLSS